MCIISFTFITQKALYITILKGLNMKKGLPTRKRVIFLGIFITALLIILTTRLAYIQIVMGKNYAQKAINQRILPIAVNRVRGDILDRNGIPLTRRKQRTFLIAFPSYFNESNSLYDIIGPMTGLDIADFTKSLKINTSYIKWEVLNPNIEIEKAIEQGKYPGLMITRQTDRYDDSSIARHVIGYIKKSDHTPQSGIERNFDEYLHSKDTQVIYAITDAKKRVLPGISYKTQESSKPSYNVQLTLDYYIQEILELALDNHSEKSGGLIIDVKTGDILALASRPNYDQNNIAEATNKKDSLWAVPMTAFAPGSLFKTVVAATGIEHGLCNGSTRYSCKGKITINGTTYKCHPKTDGLGDINMRQAFAYSCNDAFIHMAQQVGGESIIDMAEKLGLGQSLDIGLENEKGNLPIASEYAGAGIGNLALGQYKVETTPLQIGQMMTTVANDGIKKSLSLVKGIIDQSGKLIEDMYKPQDDLQVIDPNTAQELRLWMEDVTLCGTAKEAYSKEVGGTAGKTGTPQIHGDTDAHYYGWFAGYFPLDNPEYVTVILVREEFQGGEKAARIFKEVAQGIDSYRKNLEVSE